MENKDKPAFPIGIPGDHYSRTGVTKLEFFACNAPTDIPGWFKHTPPDIKIIPQPIWHEIKIQSDRDIIDMWIEVGGELPNHLKWFSDQYKAHNDSYTAFHHADNVAKYFQWRRYYAEQLLKELEK